MKSIIYYTDNRLDGFLSGTMYGDILRFSKESILKSGLPIVSCSLKPINFGKNIVLEGRERSYETMVEQILITLKNSMAKYVFFCEHDVLYHESHFDFTPPADDVYYYNVNNYRWLYPQDCLITYNGLTSLSMMCCSRELAVKHYEHRLERINEFVMYAVKSKEPKWARRLGYEPGTKPRRRGGLTDEEHVKVRSELPNIDIRHKRTFSAPKVTLESFNHPPPDFTQVTLDEIPGWNLRKLFNLL